MNRRHFLTTTLASTLASLPAAENRPRRIVLRSSWQTVNIGDIAHTPGVLALLEKHLPDVEVRLWPSSVDNGVEEMLMKRFPKLKIIKGREDILAAFAECDFLLHGSGPGFVAKKDVAKWREETGKPYGIYGITISATDCGVQGPAERREVRLLPRFRFAAIREGPRRHLPDHGVRPGWLLRGGPAQ